MDKYFSELQTQLHLPSATNGDPFSPETSIVSQSTPSARRHAWYSSPRRKIIDGVLPIMHTHIVGLVLHEPDSDEDRAKGVSLFVEESSGHRRLMQQFDETLCKVFGYGSLPWFFSYEDHNSITCRYFGHDKLVLNPPLEGRAICRQKSINEEHSMVFEHARRPIYSRKWVDLDKTIMYDGVLSIMVVTDEACKSKLSISQGNDIFVEDEHISAFSQATLNGNVYRWNNYEDSHPFYPGIPTYMDISVVLDPPVEGAKMYALVCEVDSLG